MKSATPIDRSLRKRRPRSVTLAVGAAALAAILVIVVMVATAGHTDTKPVTTHAQRAGGQSAATCASDDSRPVGPGGEGVPACPVKLP